MAQSRLTALVFRHGQAPVGRRLWFGVLSTTALLVATGCQSGASSTGMFPTTVRRVPPPPTGSYGKTAGYYRATPPAGAPGAAVPNFPAPGTLPTGAGAPGAALPPPNNGAAWPAGTPGIPVNYTASGTASGQPGTTSGWMPISANTMLPATPSTVLTPAIHSGNPYPPAGNPYPPAGAVDPTARYAEQDLDRQLAPVTR